MSVRGDISGGSTIDLKWAASSQIACFPAIRNNQFDGNHVIYKTTLPPNSTMTIELAPGSGDDLSLYAYSGDGRLPPAVTSAVSCEASHATGSGKREKVELRATKNGYDVVIGVAGARKATRGSFELLVKLDTAGPGVADTGPPPVADLASKPNATVKVKGTIDGGKVIPLKWAENSAMACFPAVRNNQFDGNHVIYKTTLPPNSTMTIELAPGSGDDLSLYAYSGDGRLPPTVSSAVSCEASHATGSGKREKVELRATKNGYDVVIGVAGARKATRGSFELLVKLDTAGPGVADTGPPPVADLASKPNATVKVKGTIDGGKVIPLKWAENSAMACFPAVRNNQFDGNHVIYKTTLPPYSTMTVELAPGSSDDLSLYAYSGDGRLPPAVTSAVSCEASHATGSGKREKVELRATKNGYDVVIGVAGARKATRGSFELLVKLDTADAGVADTGPPPVADLASKPNATVKVKGTIDGGKVIPLKWAENSAMACFPAVRNNQFDGNHVIYKTTLPPYSTMTVELAPGSSDDLSLYAYSGDGRLPPAVTSAVSCEASHATGSGKREKVELRATKNGYDVVIGVAGARKATRGSFELLVKLDTADAGVADTGPPPIADLASKPKGTVAVSGTIDGGKLIPLKWAANSAMACFPATQNTQFDGNHVLYKTTLPPYSTMVIELAPGSGDDLSLYAYSGGGGALPPSVTTAVSCEASHATGSGKTEKVELRAVKNGYDVTIGVAGARKATRGAFELKVTLK